MRRIKYAQSVQSFFFLFFFLNAASGFALKKFRGKEVSVLLFIRFLRTLSSKQALGFFLAVAGKPENPVNKFFEKRKERRKKIKNFWLENFF